MGEVFLYGQGGGNKILTENKTIIGTRDGKFMEYTINIENISNYTIILAYVTNFGLLNGVTIYQNDIFKAPSADSSIQGTINDNTATISLRIMAGLSEISITIVYIE